MLNTKKNHFSDVPGYVLHGVGFGDLTRGFADHHHQFSLVVHVLDVIRAHRLLPILRSIEQGGTTLKDFLQSDGKPGYFAQELQVYGRKGEPCRVCGTPIVATKHAQRATFYCRQCQK